MDDLIIKELSQRYYKSVGNIAFVSFYMDIKHVKSRVLSVFQITDSGYKHLMEVTAEVWSDLLMLQILENYVKRSTPA